MNQYNFSGLYSGDTLSPPRGINSFLCEREKQLRFIMACKGAMQSLGQLSSEYRADGKQDQLILNLLNQVEQDAEQMELAAIQDLCSTASKAFNALKNEQRSGMLTTVQTWLNHAIRAMEEPPPVIPQHSKLDPWTNEFKPRPGNPIRSLVVEDEFASRERLFTYLRKFGPCDVAEDGQKAIGTVMKALEQTQPYDLICLDIMMPNLDGQDALNEIINVQRRHPASRTYNTKFIMTTALHDARSAGQAMNTGCDAYVLKPLNRQKFHEALRTMGLID